MNRSRICVHLVVAMFSASMAAQSPTPVKPPSAGGPAAQAEAAGAATAAQDPKPTAGATANATKPKPPRILAVGSEAPSFPMIDVDGKPVELASYHGKVVILDFWATWCGPCKASFPHTQEVAAKYADQDVVVLASCTNDEQEKFNAWVKENQAAYPAMKFGFDPKGKAQDRASLALYGVMMIPIQFIIGKDGKVAALNSGYMKGEVLLDAALAKAGVKVAPEILKQAEQDQQRRAEAAKARAAAKPAPAGETKAPDAKVPAPTSVAPKEGGGT